MYIFWLASVLAGSLHTNSVRAIYQEPSVFLALVLFVLSLFLSSQLLASRGGIREIIWCYHHLVRHTKISNEQWIKYFSVEKEDIYFSAIKTLGRFMLHVLFPTFFVRGQRSNEIQDSFHFSSKKNLLKILQSKYFYHYEKKILLMIRFFSW